MRVLIDLVRLCLCLSALFLVAEQVQAEGADVPPAKHGLMWHRSGLPAVFPLQVKTLGPQDYYVTLTDFETEETVLAAYIEGGRFFRVLVPPGTFEVRFAYGNIWQGEEALFGPEGKTSFFDMPDPLTFGVRNYNTKGGHLVDLRDISPGQEARVVPEALFLCQGVRLVQLPDVVRRGPVVERSLRTGVPRFRDRPPDDPRIAEALAWLAHGTLSEKVVVDHGAPPGVTGGLRFDVRRRPCAPAFLP